MLDEQPFRALDRLRALAPGPNEYPSPAKPLAFEHDLHLAALIPLAKCCHGIGWIAVGRVSPTIPEHHRSAAVLAFWDRPLERVVLDRMILDLHRQALGRCVE